MARLEWVDERLRRWAAWVTVGDGSGYPVVSVLHENWHPPSPGVTPTLKVSHRGDAAETHAAIRRLSRRQADTLVVVYVCKVPLIEQARRLECSVNTIPGRIDRACQALARELCNNHGTG